MNSYQPLHFPLRFLALATLAGTLIACSDENPSSLANISPDNQVITRGTVTALDTVTVNGRTFSTAETSIFQDDQLVGEEALQTGMQVVVQSQNGAAIGIHYEEDVKGPIDSIDADGNFFVMGQSVLISPNTRFDNSSVDAINVGDIVEVSGLRDTNGLLHATFVEYKQSVSDAYKVQGSVSQLNTQSLSFVIGELLIDYSNANFDDVSADSLSNGLIIEVNDQSRFYEPGSFFLSATKIEQNHDIVDISQTGNSITGASQRTEIEMEAFVTEIVTDELFRLGGIPVRILATTRFRDGERAQLQVNSRVEVEGWLNIDGELEAWEIEFDDDFDYFDSENEESESSSSENGEDSNEDNDDTEVVLEGVVSAMNLESGTLVVNGIEVRVGNGTEFENNDDQSITLSNFFNLIEVGGSVIKIKWKSFVSYTDTPHEVEF